jgi:[FeFe] hydrogenase H-cluster maturation GTPase HydF
MSTLNQTPSGERLHISIFGRRNAGKSSLINALTRQPIAIVSPVAGTTTDPVGKAMELLPLGPVVLTDTAGIDDDGELGQMRVARTLRVLDTTDLAILVVEAGSSPGPWEEELAGRAAERGIPLVVVASKADVHGAGEAVGAWAARKGVGWLAVSTGDEATLEALKNLLIATCPQVAEPSMLGDLVAAGDVVVMVVPIDSAAPKGRLILPQVMAVRDVLDHDGLAMVVKEGQLRACLQGLGQRPKLVVTDSQAFGQVARDTPREVMMTSFSILMARYKGDLQQFVDGVRALRELRAGARVLISEGCTHHRQRDDIGTVQLPAWLRKQVGGELQLGFSTGVDFPPDLQDYQLVVHCGSCTLHRREVLRRQRQAREAGVPMTNYGVCLAAVNGILERALEPFPRVRLSLAASGPAEAR